MSSVEKWLQDLVLEKYLGVFEDAEIDVETLPDLSEQDLRDLDLPVGPRRKIWNSLNAKRAVNAAARPMQEPGHVSANHAERRHLTIMFVDLGGSTQLAMRLDAEELREVISQYQNSVASVVRGFDGFVATLMGDGVLC